MTKVYNRMILAVALAVVATASASSLNQMSYADSDDPPFLPSECEPYVGQPSTDHILTIVTPGPYLPGDEIELQASTTDTGTGTSRVRVVAILEGTTIHDNLLLLPNPSGSVDDSFTLPGDAKQGDALDIYACFESPGSLKGDGVTPPRCRLVLCVARIPDRHSSSGRKFAGSPWRIHGNEKKKHRTAAILKR